MAGNGAVNVIHQQYCRFAVPARVPVVAIGPVGSPRRAALASPFAAGGAAPARTAGPAGTSAAAARAAGGSRKAAAAGRRGIPPQPTDG